MTLAIGTSFAHADIPIDLDPEVECLAVALYHEARGLSYDGMLSVGTVIMNRVNSDKYPNTVCEVIAQPYQFSYFGNGKPETYSSITEAVITKPTIYDAANLRFAVDIAHTAYSEHDVPFGEDVLYYHTTTVNPKWNDAMTMVDTIDEHIFWSL